MAAKSVEELMDTVKGDWTPAQIKAHPEVYAMFDEGTKKAEKKEMGHFKKAGLLTLGTIEMASRKIMDGATRMAEGASDIVRNTQIEKATNSLFHLNRRIGELKVELQFQRISPGEYTEALEELNKQIEAAEEEYKELIES